MKTVMSAVNELRGDVEHIEGTGGHVWFFDGEYEKASIDGHQHRATLRTDKWSRICTVPEFESEVKELSAWQPSIQTETPEEKEALETITESKPIFTQAMADAGESPPVGAEVNMVGSDETYTVTAVGRDHILFIYKGIEYVHDLDLSKIKPIQTEREKAIESALSKIVVPVNIDAVKMVLGATFDADLLKCQNYRKSQAKAYDDKTEYFGEEYK